MSIAIAHGVQAAYARFQLGELIGIHEARQDA